METASYYNDTRLHVTHNRQPMGVELGSRSTWGWFEVVPVGSVAGLGNTA